jgi:aldehyde dehydrogenase (NAD+)
MPSTAVTSTLARMGECFIDGGWQPANGSTGILVEDPSSGKPIGELVPADGADVDRAVKAARRAFDDGALPSSAERCELLDAVIACYGERVDDLADVVSLEMGAPLRMARAAQVMAGLEQLRSARRALADFEFEAVSGTTLIRHEPIGVCALITPWNWPLNQIGAKVGAALAAGCTMVLKPSEVAPLSALMFAEILAAAGLPAGVFNLINGNGPQTGASLAAHPGVDMVSFTGSTRGGAAVAISAAPTVKRVCQELGGKSAHIVSPDVDVEDVVRRAVRRVFGNAGQSCDSVARILVPATGREAAVSAAREAASAVVVGPPRDSGTEMGPLASRDQLIKVRGLVQRATEAGAVVVAGGNDAAVPEDGFYYPPTVLADVEPNMEIAHEEIFGPVALIMTYDGIDEAVAIANDTAYGLSGRVTASSRSAAMDIARRLRTGMVYLNDADADFDAPFGGYRMSGNGREGGSHGIREYLETQAVMGAAG